MGLNRLLFLLLFSITAFCIEENFLLIDGKSSEVILERGDIDQRMSPCSTFKIPLGLMGYETGILKDEMHPILDFHEGYDDWLPSWKTSHSPLSWMKHSCVWYSKNLSLKLGLTTIQNYLASFTYGNQSIATLVEPGPLDPAWINSSLEISAKEQVHFLQKMLAKTLPISDHALGMTKALTFKEELGDGWKLFGKTGYSNSINTPDGLYELGWFIGWIEKGDQIYIFAYNIQDIKVFLAQKVINIKELVLNAEKIQKSPLFVPT